MRAFSFPKLKRKSQARTAPHANPTVQPVNVKPPKGHRCVIDNEPDPLEFNPDPFMAAEIRLHLWLQRNAREVTP